MADGLNRVMLLGSLGADPELRSTNSGESVLRLRLATNERYQDKQKEWKEKVEWHSITVWGKRAEALHRILSKGSSLFIEGALRTSSYDDKEGVKRYKTEIVAKEVILTGGKGGGAGASSGGSDGFKPGRSAGDKGGAPEDPHSSFTGGDDDSIPF